MLISPSLFIVILFLPVVAAAAIAVEDGPMIHHTGHSGTAVQNQVVRRQQGLFDITTEADMVQVLISDRRPVHCGILTG